MKDVMTGSSEVTHLDSPVPERCANCVRSSVAALQSRYRLTVGQPSRIESCRLASIRVLVLRQVWKS